MFFSVFQVNREIHLALRREQMEKCFLEGSWEGGDELGGGGVKQSLLMLISPPPHPAVKNLKEGETEKFFFLSPALS